MTFPIFPNKLFSQIISFPPQIPFSGCQAVTGMGWTNATEAVERLEALAQQEKHTSDSPSWPLPSMCWELRGHSQSVFSKQILSAVILCQKHCLLEAMPVFVCGSLPVYLLCRLRFYHGLRGAATAHFTHSWLELSFRAYRSCCPQAAPMRCVPSVSSGEVEVVSMTCQGPQDWHRLCSELPSVK